MKAKKVVPLTIPEKIIDVSRWLILGLDPSLSRTGFALMEVSPQVSGTVSNAHWLKIGSVKPEESSDPIWVRGKAMSVFLRDLLMGIEKSSVIPGLIISMEYPTPRNDFLVSLCRILHLVFFEQAAGLESAYPNGIYIQQTNASTLRSLMGLSKKGNNKDENKRRAYDFVNQQTFPELDSDSCDAVLLTMMARHTASILMGLSDEVPEAFKIRLCNSETETKGKGRNQRIITKGLLHRKEYWYSYHSKTYSLRVKDASIPKKTLARTEFVL